MTIMKISASFPHGMDAPVQVISGDGDDDDNNDDDVGDAAVDDDDDDHINVLFNMIVNYLILCHAAASLDVALFNIT